MCDPNEIPLVVEVRWERRRGYPVATASRLLLM